MNVKNDEIEKMNWKQKLRKAYFIKSLGMDQWDRIYVNRIYGRGVKESLLYFAVNPLHLCQAQAIRGGSCWANRTGNEGGANFFCYSILAF